MKILQLSPQFVFPANDGGKIGIANILKQFSKQGHEVTFFCFSNDKIDRKYIDEALKYCKLIVFPHSTKNTMFRILMSVLHNRSLYISKHNNKKIRKKVDEIIKENDFEVVHADHTCMAPLAYYINKRKKIPWGLRLHNIEWVIWQRYFERLNKWQPKAFYIENQADLLRKIEKNMISAADVCFPISDIDYQRALDLSKDAHLAIAPPGVDPTEWVPENTERDPYELILATTYDWIHNVDGLKWFIDKVLPKVRKHFPKTKLTLLGKNPPDWLSYYKEKGVNLIGYVDKVQPYYNKASVFIVPLFVGSGFRIKIIEAMAMELPVVSTSLGAEGNEASEQDGLYRADSSNDFAYKIIQLFQDQNHLRGIGRKAKVTITEKYTWEKSVGTMIEEYKKLI